MSTASVIHARPSHIAYAVKTHYAALLLDHLRNIDHLRAGITPKHNVQDVIVTELYGDGSTDSNTDSNTDNSAPTYKLRYIGKQGTHRLNLVICESATHAYTDRVEKTFVINDGEKYVEYTFYINTLRSADNYPIVIPTHTEPVTNKHAASMTGRLDKEILTALDLCVN